MDDSHRMGAELDKVSCPESTEEKEDDAYIEGENWC